LPESSHKTERKNKSKTDSEKWCEDEGKGRTQQETRERFQGKGRTANKEDARRVAEVIKRKKDKQEKMGGGRPRKGTPREKNSRFKVGTNMREMPSQAKKKKGVEQTGTRDQVFRGWKK